MSAIRTVQARVDLPFHRMTETFGSWGLRAGGPIVMDPFLNLDDFMMSEPTFPPHPHAGFSAVTYMFEDSPGAFINRDSLGDRSRIGPGSFHWTQAARGMMHEEIPERPGTQCHGLQMFVNLEAAHKNAPPRAFHVERAAVPEVKPAPGVRVRVLAGSFHGTASPLDALMTPVTFLDVHLGPTATLEMPVVASHTAFGLVVQGDGHVGREATATAIKAHAAVGFANDGDRLRWVAGKNGLQVLIGMGAPLGEPVVFGGPFVMTSQQAVREADQRFRRGEMGSLTPSF